MSQMPLIDVRGLNTHFFTEDGVVRAIDGIDFTVMPGRTLCVVGESGCGKSVTGRSILRIVDRPGRIVSGSILYRDRDGNTVDLAALAPMSRQMRQIRGAEIGMVFQEPMTAFGPVHTIGRQIGETIQLHFGVSKAEARSRTIALLRRVGIPSPEERIDAYPFQLSGGLRQRAMIALGLAGSPRLLIADEPTTALDVTTQAVILDLLKDLMEESDLSVMFITHDLGVVAEIADDVAVIYLGRVVEQAPVETLFAAPKHPYTQALIRSTPKLGGGREPLASIPGSVPSPFNRPKGCSFHPRCPSFMPGRCDVIEPRPVRTPDRTTVRCLLHEDASEVAQ